MLIRQLHPWDLPPAEAVALQKQLRDAVCLSPGFDPSAATLIAGVDVSADRFNPMLSAGVVVWDRETGEVIDEAAVQEEGEFPYIPGLLSFREIPSLVKALAKLKVEPHAILVDGQGIAHPRRLGIAAHLALLVDIPTVGVAKSKLTGTYDSVSEKEGSLSMLRDGDEQIGWVLRTKARSNPLFISPGGGLGMDQSLELVKLCVQGYRLPEPTRLAHMYVNEIRKGGLP